MSSTEAKSGETPRSTFRLPAAVLARMDEIAAEDVADSGRQANRTQVIIDLVNKEHARRQKKEKGK